MTTPRPRWQLEPVGTAPQLFLAVAILLLPLGMTLAAILYGSGDPTQAGSGSPPPWMTIAGVALFCAALWGVLMYALRRHRLVLEDGALQVATSFYGRRLALAELRLDGARVIDLDEHTGFRPMLKTNGVSVPGFRSGWFRLRNRERALVATAAGKRVVWIPTHAGYGLLLQPRHPQALLDALEKMADAARRR